MKKIIATVISALLALSAVSCAANGSGGSADSSAAEDTSSVQSDSESVSDTDKAPDDPQIITSDGSEYPELIDCLKRQLTAAAENDYDTFKETLDPRLMAEVFFALSEQEDEEISIDDISDETLELMTENAFGSLSAVMKSGFDGELIDLNVQTDSLPTAGCRLFSVSFTTNDMKSCYATVYEKDGSWGAIIEAQEDMMAQLNMMLHFAAESNASLIGDCAELAIDTFGAIPDGEYTFDVAELTVITEPKNALEAMQSAVAEAFSFDSDADEGEMFLLVSGGKPYVQWRSYNNPEIVGEYPAHDEDEDYTPVWGSPDV